MNSTIILEGQNGAEFEEMRKERCKKGERILEEFDFHALFTVRI
jgi:hypothetical protein